MLRSQPARLLATDKSAPGARLVILRDEEATVGSAEGSTLQLSAPGVGGRHALIRRARGRYYLVDLKAGGGTRINAASVRRRYRLRHGDQLSFGSAVPYRFIDPDGAKRLRNLRLIQLSAVAAAIAAAIAVHLSGWDRRALSPGSIAEFVRSNWPLREYLTPRTAAAKSTRPIATAAPPPSAVAAASGGHGWLDRLNHYRAMAGLSALKDDPKLSAGVAAHAYYLMINFAGKIRDDEPLGDSDHDEDPSRAGYSAEGRAAAANSQIALGCGAYDLNAQIDQWFAAPFGRFAMLNPSISTAGFGEARNEWCWVAGLRLPPGPEEVKAYTFPVEFPPAGATVSLRWTGLDSPDPLAACPGYTAPVGLPITLQLGYLVDPALGAYSLTGNGRPPQSCAYDAPGYRNSVPSAQEYGRWALRSSGAVVLIPRAPLQSGTRYSVSITAYGHVYAWSFRVAR